MSLSEPTFEDAVAQLLDENSALSREMLSFFSDMTLKQLSMLKEYWGEISIARRQAFVASLKRDL